MKLVNKSYWIPTLVYFNITERSANLQNLLCILEIIIMLNSRKPAEPVHRIEIWTCLYSRCPSRILMTSPLGDNFWLAISRSLLTASGLVRQNCDLSSSDWLWSQCVLIGDRFHIVLNLSSQSLCSSQGFFGGWNFCSAFLTLSYFPGQLSHLSP